MPRPSQCSVCGCFETCIFPADPDCAEYVERKVSASMKITSVITLDLTDGPLLGEDVIAFADELRMRQAEKEVVQVSVNVEKADRGYTDIKTATISHTSDSRPSKNVQVSGL